MADDHDAPVRPHQIQPVWLVLLNIDGGREFASFSRFPPSCSQWHHVVIPFGWSLHSHPLYGVVYQHTCEDRGVYTARELYEAAKVGRDGFRLATEAEVEAATERYWTAGSVST